MRSPVPLASLLALASCLLPIARAQQPASSEPGSACTLQGRNYLCSKPALQQALASARTVALVSQPANHASDAALASLAKSLGKAVSSGDEAHPADLTLRLTPIEPAGVSVGLNTTDLAMLNIFVAAPGNPTARLLWSETYNGSPDMPWPSVTRALTRQLLSRLGLK
ncbi:MAG: hypothetical protein NVSMB3_04120 [Acidobacteriaceae bacterium]